MATVKMASEEFARQVADEKYKKPNGGIPKEDMDSEVQSALDLARTALQEHQSLDAYVTGAEYDSTEKKIYLKHGDTRLGDPIDAKAFVKDGIVDSVEIKNGNLVITFNIDAGKDPISIPITDIFNPSDYYNKTTTDNKLSGKADKVSSATNNNFAALDSNGNLKDSGKKPADFVQLVTNSVDSGKDAVTIGTRTSGSGVGKRTLAVGQGNVVSGTNAFAAGGAVAAEGMNSAALVNNSSAKARGSFVIGLYNVSDRGELQGLSNVVEVATQNDLPAAADADADTLYIVTGSGDPRAYRLNASGTALSEVGGIFSVVFGANAVAKDRLTFVWSGSGNSWIQKALAEKYASHGAGTFNVDPVNGLEGFFIGETTLKALLDAKAAATHKSSHATGGADALSPSDIGAATPAQIGIPAFESTATYAVGAKVVHDNAIWNCTTAVSTAGEWSTVGSNFTKLFDLDTGAPVSGGTKLVTNGQVRTALQDKANASDLPYAISESIPLTVTSGAASTTLADRTHNVRTVAAPGSGNTTSITATLPPIVTGKSRDMFLNLTVGSAASDAGDISLSIVEPNGANVQIDIGSVEDIGVGKNEILISENALPTTSGNTTTTHWLVTVRHEDFA